MKHLPTTLAISILCQASLISSGCVGSFGSNNLHDDYYLVEFLTSYKPRGLSGEPPKGSPCGPPCEVAFSLGPLQAPAPVSSKMLGGKNNQSADDGGQSTTDLAVCTKPAGQYWTPIRQGERAKACSDYRATFDNQGSFGFWVPKEPTMFLHVGDILGRVSKSISNCRNPSYQSVYEWKDGEERKAVPRLNVTNDLTLPMEFTIGCFGGD